MKGKGLAEAKRLFHARKYSEVIRILEPEVFRYRESFDYFLLLGTSCLHTNDLGGAHSYISRALQLHDDDMDALLVMAAILLLRGENENAIKKWLEVLDQQPSNAVAQRGMNLLRKGLTPDSLQHYRDSGKLRLILPQGAFHFPWVAVSIVVLGALIVSGLVYLGVHVMRSPESGRPGVSAIEIPADLPSLIEQGTDATYILTGREVTQAFQKARKYLLAWRDNMAAVEINRILLSNATLSVKERARMLKGFITKPDSIGKNPLNPSDAFSYQTVKGAPALYDGCYVSWKGKIANLKIGDDSITFDLLVGFDQEKILEGIVPVTLSFSADLTNGIPLQVLGRVSATEGRVTLQGISIHKM